MTTQSPRTVRVRIPVAVTKDGEWYANAGDSDDDAYNKSQALYPFAPESLAHIVWLTANVPLPDEHEIAATVERETDR